MSEYESKVINYSDLSGEEQQEASDNGAGKDSANYLRVIFNDETVLLESDAMEPEDATFLRDLSWIKGILDLVYSEGVKNGEAAKKVDG